MIRGRDVSLNSARLLASLLLGCAPALGLSSANVGCLFSEQVCLEGEVCYDDLVLGRCLSTGEDEDDITRLGPLSGPPLDLLAAEMRRLFSQGYTWKDEYSQCVFQTILDHIAKKEFYSSEECSHLARNDDITIDETNDGELDEDDLPADDKIVFDSDPRLPRRGVLHQHTGDLDPDPEAQFDEEIQDDNLAYFPSEYLPLGGQRSGRQTEADPPLPEILSVIPADFVETGFPVFEEDDDNDVENAPYAGLPEVIPVYVESDDDVPIAVPELIRDDDDDDDVELAEPGVPEVPGEPGILGVPGEPAWIPATRSKRPSSPDWTPLRTTEDDNSSDENSSTYDFDYNDSSAVEENDDADTIYYPDEARLPVETIFDRSERLDVKKPGPFFANSQNNFFLNKLVSLEDEEHYPQTIEKDPGQSEYEMPLTMQSKQKKSLKDKHKLRLLGFEESPAEDSYLIVNIKDRFKTLGQAMNVIEAISKFLVVPAQTFGEPTLWTSRLSIPVQSNPRKLNASSMAQVLGNQIDLINKRMDKENGVVIESFSAGNQNDVVSVFTGHSRLFLALFLLTAGLASVLVVGCLVLILRKRRGKKLEAKEDGESKEEPVKEYKQLVRDWSRSSRASQSSGAPAAEDGAKGRTASEDGAKKQPLSGLPTKHQNSEGSRTSSTSSWQEDPGVSTMDISTGHMVLAYMEDHLNNKQRLEQEWVGLCAYEAEPAATSVAFKVENKKKNRYPDKLPYDHNRVLLNALVNGNNSDYINASTVTDHDPRNPAYIVTQGPMAHTTADFWQMVWEQGSVVIVMLSRLSENGYQLVHRYWPEDGSNQYHIYEVHLVSEHVWCDDYLVRSLYLKNTQTGETRTVTQFHFLSWADGCTPESTKSLLEFRRKVNKSYRGRSCPIIVHCSDGAGRSGTYVLIDMVLNRMNKGSKEIDIAATLEHIRDQRSGMVQTRSQFEFCLTSVAEETHAILKSLAQ